MAIANEWTTPDELEAVATEEARSADFNALLGNVLFLSNPPTCIARLTASQEVASGTDHIIEYDEAAVDTTRSLPGDTEEQGDMWDDSSPGVLVAPRVGMYLIVASALWEGTTEDNSKRDLFIEVNGTMRLAMDSRLSTSSPEGQVSLVTSLGVNDYIEVGCRQLSGDSLNLQALNRTRVCLTWLRLSPDEFGES